MKTQLRELFPIFSQSELVDDISKKSQLLEVPAKRQIIDSGDIIQIVPLVISGVIKVFREDDQGNEIFLYYIRSGESCAMTLSSCLKREKSSVKAITQSDSIILALPIAAVHYYLHKYPSWNDFMVETYSKRFDEILDVVDTISFKKMDIRLLKYLMSKAQILGTRTLDISKTAIAKDLNSSREVISRLLKQMEKNKLIRMDKSIVELL